MAEETKESDAFFDHFSREDKPTGMGMRLTRALAQRIFDYTQAERGSGILEIGPGRGDFADICLKEGMDYSAIEANRQMAESLKERGASVVQAMVPPLPSLEKQFDIVVMINVMEHMNSMADALQITQQVRDVLKPGGRFVICSPDYLNWRR
ncbi:MAG: class I SAM-dependent methyltransferase, partial [Planctomycetota bacterium]